MSTTAKVWNGASALRRSLVPVADLEPFPDNPRRGDAQALRVSLERFGQVRPVLVDGQRIVAGHHVVEAAKLAGWTHVAVTQNEFASEEERRAYLIADNGLGQLGGYDDELLVAHLRELAEMDALAGTGYDAGDLDDRLAALHRASQPPADPADRLRPPPLDVREVVLNFSPEQFAQFETWAKIVSHEKGTHGISETCFVALELAARQLNQG